MSTRHMIFFMVIALVLLALLVLPVTIVADDCGGHRCPPPEITTPEPTVVVAPWAPVSPLVLLPAISK